MFCAIPSDEFRLCKHALDGSSLRFSKEAAKLETLPSNEKQRAPQNYHLKDLSPYLWGPEKRDTSRHPSLPCGLLNTKTPISLLKVVSHVVESKDRDLIKRIGRKMNCKAEVVAFISGWVSAWGLIKKADL